MKKIQFYDVSKAYIDELYKVDTEVRISREKFRPHLAAKIEIADRYYLIPLSSPKDKKYRAKDITDTIYDKTKIIGYLEYHKMIPFHDSIAKKVDIKSLEDESYGALMQKDYLYIARELGFEHVHNKANLIYNARYNEDHYLYQRYLKNFGTDIKKLEQVLDLFVQKNQEKIPEVSVTKLTEKQKEIDKSSNSKTIEKQKKTITK